jgi:hypothetical protein
MDLNNKEPMKRSYIKTRPIISLIVGLTFFTIILIAMILAVTSDATKSGKAGGGSNKGNKEEPPLETVTMDKNEFLGVIKEVDQDFNLITLYDIDQQESITLSYHGGTDITDKYGQPITASQVPIGTMVDYNYIPDKDKLTKMKISTKAWEYIGVTNLNINKLDKVMTIVSTKYKYTEDLIILDEQDFISVNDLAEQDEITIRGFEETIWSMTVTRGHGTVKLEDYESFLGAHITIGYESIQQIVEDMMITVREGNFNLTVENGRYSATKNIEVVRNEETVVSLSDLGPEALKQGRVTFVITPFGADLYVDDQLESYAEPLELSYGDHKIVVSLGGYITYQGMVSVDAAGKIIKIDLPETSSNKEAIVTETENTTTTPPEADANPDENPDSSEEDELIIDKKHHIYIQNPIGASVYLNGDFMGISPTSFKKIIGNHVLTFIEEGRETISYTVEVENDDLDTYFTFPDLTKKLN